MEPPSQPQPIPHANSAPTSGQFSDSANSSPRLRMNDTWDPATATAASAEQHTLPSKIRLMCSYGGHIVPRPHDKSLCYVGGETRIVVVDRHATSLASLRSHLAKSLLNGRPFTLKYQLPNEDLDSLITVSTDEDLENMIDEQDRAASNPNLKSSRLRLFLFPLKLDSVPSNIGSILDPSPKSEDWFLTALNRGFSNSAPVNSLLNLDDEAAAIQANSDSGGFRDDAKGAKQDIHSVPDSPMLDTGSSFGSTSSSPSIANLPAIRVRVDESGGQKLGIEDQFANMAMGAGLGQKYDDAPVVQSPPPLMPSGLPIPTSGGFVGGERVVSDDERSDHGVPIGYRRVVQVQPQLPPLSLTSLQTQPKPSGVLDLASPDSVSSEGSLKNPLSRGKLQDPVIQVQAATRSNVVDPMISLSDPIPHPQGLPLQQQQTPESAAYLLQPQQQQQFVQGGPHYIQHPTGSVPMTAYYPLYQPHQHHLQHHLDQQQYTMYYMQQPQTSTRPQTPPTAAAAAAAMAPPPSIYRTAKPPEVGGSAGMYRVAAPGGGTQLVQMQPPGQQPQYVGYSPIHHLPGQSMAAPTSAAYGYEYANTAAAAAPPSPHPQIYYTPQFQTIPTSVAMPDTAESGKQQIRTSQAL